MPLPSHNNNRNKNDMYQTPYSLTRLFLVTNPLDKSLTTLECACGGGAIVKVLKEYGFNPMYYDKEHDFLKDETHYSQIITNPPFKQSMEFILHAKKVSDTFAMLLPLNYLQSKKRYNKLWKDDFKLKSVSIFTRYVLMSDDIEEDGKADYRGGVAFAWFLWDKSYKGEPTIKWLDNQRFLKKLK